jgi:hypothetical protein
LSQRDCRWRHAIVSHDNRHDFFMSTRSSLQHGPVEGISPAWSAAALVKRRSPQGFRRASMEIRASLRHPGRFVTMALLIWAVCSCVRCWVEPADALEPGGGC